MSRILIKAIYKFLDPRRVRKIPSLVLNSLKKFGNLIKILKNGFGRNNLLSNQFTLGPMTHATLI